MSSQILRRISLVVLALVAIVGWVAFFVSSESPDNGQAGSTGSGQELQALQQKFAELQSEQQSLIQENIALRTLSENRRDEGTSGSGRTPYLRLPGGREVYLEQRLRYASEQLRRHRKGMYQQSTESVDLNDATTEPDRQIQNQNDTSAQFEDESQQLRMQLADQAELFEKERMNYAQMIEDLSDKLETMLVAATGQSSSTESESVTRDTDSASEMPTQTAGDSQVPVQTEDTETPVESEQKTSLAVAAVQPATQTGSSGDSGSVQDPAESNASELIEEQINGILEKLEMAEQNSPMTTDAQARIDELNQQFQIERNELNEQFETERSELNQQLQRERDENQNLNHDLQALNDKVAMLTTELNSANERTLNMEIMANTITDENRRLGELIDDLQNTIGMTIAEKDDQISSIQADFAKIEYSTDILFESGSPVLSEKGRQILKEFIVNLESDEFATRVVSIEGHTDDVPISGDLLTLYPTNWELSMARAASATRYLIEQGVDAERLRPAGLGSSKPRASNDTEAGRAANRRIEIHLVPELVKSQN